MIYILNITIAAYCLFIYTSALLFWRTDAQTGSHIHQTRSLREAKKAMTWHLPRYVKELLTIYESGRLYHPQSPPTKVRLYWWIFRGCTGVNFYLCFIYKLTRTDCFWTSYSLHIQLCETDSLFYINVKNLCMEDD